MKLKNKIEEDIKTFMKSKQTVNLSVVRQLKTAIEYHVTNQHKKPLTDDVIINIVRKQIKQREESSKIYRSVNNIELAFQEEKEIEILKNYLPQELSKDEVYSIVRDVISEIGATSIKDMG